MLKTELNHKNENLSDFYKTLPSNFRQNLPPKTSPATKKFVPNGHKASLHLKKHLQDYKKSGTTNPSAHKPVNCLKPPNNDNKSFQSSTSNLNKETTPQQSQVQYSLNDKSKPRKKNSSQFNTPQKIRNLAKKQVEQAQSTEQGKEIKILNDVLMQGDHDDQISDFNTQNYYT